MTNTYLTFLLADITQAIGLVIAMIGIFIAARSYSRTVTSKAEITNNGEHALQVRKYAKRTGLGLWILFVGIGIQAFSAVFVLIVY